jgi:hypothetical protein
VLRVVVVEDHVVAVPVELKVVVETGSVKVVELVVVGRVSVTERVLLVVYEIVNVLVAAVVVVVTPVLDEVTVTDVVRVVALVEEIVVEDVIL